jgi:predicted phosphodiesterase
MKIAVLADIHANLAALQTAVAHLSNWQPDYTIIAGDLVNRGPRPAECLALVLEKVCNEGWLLIRGNHEDYVLKNTLPGAVRSGPAFEAHRPSYWTYAQLNGQIPVLQSMPLEQILYDPSGGLARFVHGSLLGVRDGIYPETSDPQLRLKIGLDQQRPGEPPLVLFGVGHTHRALIRRLEGVLVVNAGSVGLPFDGDRRLAYAQLTFQHGHWQAEIVRLAYNLAQTERDFYSTGYLEDGGPLTRLVQIELRTARSQLYSWAIKYQEAAEQGRITVEQAVNEYLGGAAMTGGD